MQQGGRRKLPLACFCCGGCWAGRAGGFVCEAVNKPQCTGAALGGTGDSAPESRLWCPLNAGGTCLHPSGIAHGLLFTLGCPAPGLTRAELSFLSIFHGQEMLPSPLPGLETNSEGLRDSPKAWNLSGADYGSILRISPTLYSQFYSTTPSRLFPSLTVLLFMCLLSLCQCLPPGSEFLMAVPPLLGSPWYPECIAAPS